MDQLQQEVDPAEVGLDPAALDRLDRFYARRVNDGLLPGYLVSVSRHGRVAHLTSYGLRDREAGLPVTADTVWRLYSMTKPVASVAALMLHEEGLLGLDDPVSRHLPSFADLRVYESGTGDDLRTRPADGPLLVRHLLTHTAGMTIGAYRTHPVDALYRAAGVEIQAPEGADLAEACELYASLPLQFEPGTQWNYSVATNVVGRLIEVVTGRPLDAFLAERVFAPLGMTDTGFHVSGEQADRLAVLYQENQEPPEGQEGEEGQEGRAAGITPLPGPPVHERPRLLSCSSGLVGTAGDYHRFMEFLRRRGELDGVRLLSPDTVDTMTTNQLPADLHAFGSRPIHGQPDNAGLGFGLGVSVVVDADRTPSPESEGSYGWSGAGGTTFWVDPRNDLTVQFMTQVRPAATLSFHELKSLVHEALEG
ncbi:serine hydrolase domain-containing protein [Streptomyces sp. NPDC057620]|uniref:serine hydrolase domain-containing protein n=1 Tax=Streptomyces sp. NPDC057620 TaxID=3346185 RepID=UPI00367E5463